MVYPPSMISAAPKFRARGARWPGRGHVAAGAPPAGAKSRASRPGRIWLCPGFLPPSARRPRPPPRPGASAGRELWLSIASMLARATRSARMGGGHESPQAEGLHVNRQVCHPNCQRQAPSGGRPLALVSPSQPPTPSPGCRTAPRDCTPGRQRISRRTKWTQSSSPAEIQHQSVTFDEGLSRSIAAAIWPASPSPTAAMAR